MELRDCYAEFGGDYKEVLGRLQREQTVQKFVLKFLDDKSFSSLETACKTGITKKHCALSIRSKGSAGTFLSPDCTKAAAEYDRSV